MTRATGIDISHYDVSFNPPAIGGPQFVCVKAGYGNGLTKDPLFDALMPGVLKVPVRGAYYYLNSGVDWKAQAVHFLSIISGRDFHYFVCDFEGTFNVLSVGFAAAAMEWCNYVKTQTGKPVVIYSNISTYQDYLSKDSRAKTYPLWIAWPPDPSPDPQIANPRMPAARSDWAFWQYSFGEHNTFGAANGVGRTGVDVDVYNGTLDQLRAWLGLGTVTPPPALTLEERVARLEKIHNL